jgi:hypothetical protein|tara:strand:- start:1467 stop:1958 length:492 start_codon:yes stop_codon:yes gene_type:complete
MMEVHDGVLEEHNAILIDDAVKQLSWKYDYHSEPSKPNKHWHVLCGHDFKELTANGYDWADHIFNAAKSKLNKELTYERIYCNAHTHGIEPHLHIDDGEFTMIYYPRLNWHKEWGGGTMVDGELVQYVGNRLVIFDAHLPHKAMPVSRECYELRTNVVFKCHV